MWSVDPIIKDTPAGEYAKDINAWEEEGLEYSRENMRILTGMVEKLDTLLQEFFTSSGGRLMLDDTVRSCYALDADGKSTQVPGIFHSYIEILCS
jgi:hypothetical protein